MVSYRRTPVAPLAAFLAAGEPISVPPARRPLHTTPLLAPVGAPLGEPIGSLDVLLEYQRSKR